MEVVTQEYMYYNSRIWQDDTHSFLFLKLNQAENDSNLYFYFKTIIIRIITAIQGRTYKFKSVILRI